MDELRFRQVHLYFHTSEHIPGVGSRFDPEQFVAALRLGQVNSVTCFSRGHHGWCYHPTEVGEMHPSLTFDLLGSIIEVIEDIVPLGDIPVSSSTRWSWWTIEGWERTC